MKGFFEVRDKPRTGRRKGIAPGTVLDCNACGLYKTCKTPYMPVTGQGGMGVLIIAEAPGELEDARGTQLIGPAGQCLRKSLAKFDVDLDRDCWKINAVNCRPVDNETPDEVQYKSCWRQMVLPVIQELHPRTIILLGGTALNQWLTEFWPEKVSISTIRGYCIPDHDLGAWVCPTYHPSYVMRQGQDKYGRAARENVAQVIWEQDLYRALNNAGETMPDMLIDNDLFVVSEQDAVEEMDVLKAGLMEFDFETTGLKPQKRGHRILCCSICYKAGDSICFPITPVTVPPLKTLLTNPNIGKMAHNMKFEDIWSSVILECDVNNWAWDSMIAAHLSDNRAGTKGLDFQGLVHFGVKDYSSWTEPFIRGKDEKDANSFNRMAEAPLEKVMKYCAMDSLIGYNLAMMQMERVK